MGGVCEIKLNPAKFGRVAAQNAKQSIKKDIKDKGEIPSNSGGYKFNVITTYTDNSHPGDVIYTDIADYSHWPKQLYYHTEEDGSVTLAYHRWQSYYASPIAGLDDNEMVSEFGKFGQIDQKFVTMVNNTDDYPNNDQMGGDGTIVKQGFLPQQP